MIKSTCLFLGNAIKSLGSAIKSAFNTVVRMISPAKREVDRISQLAEKAKKSQTIQSKR